MKVPPLSQYPFQSFCGVGSCTATGIALVPVGAGVTSTGVSLVVIVAKVDLAGAMRFPGPGHIKRASISEVVYAATRPAQD